MTNMIKIWLLLFAVTAGISDSSQSCAGDRCSRGSWGRAQPVFIYRPKSSPEPTSDQASPQQSTDTGNEQKSRYVLRQPRVYMRPKDQSSSNDSPLQTKAARVEKKTYSVEDEHSPAPADSKPDIASTEQQGGDSNNNITLKGYGRGERICPKCESCSPSVTPTFPDCKPTDPKIKNFKWAKEHKSFNLEANFNLIFKEKKFWLRIKAMLKNAIENALGERCTLCEPNPSSSRP